MLGTRKSRIGPEWESGKEMHFSGAAYGFLISLCKGKPGAGGLADCSCPHSPHHPAATTPGPRRRPHFSAMLA